MIILNQKKFAFLHIPKCGGSTLQKWLRLRFTTSANFYGKTEHPEIGTVYREHLTLRQLKQHYPDALADLRANDTYAIIRDPLSRFESALGQYVNEMRGGNITLMAPEDITALAQDILDQLRQLNGGFRFELTHFQPQAAFIELEGERIVTHLRDLTAMDATIAELSAQLDVAPPEVTRQNERKEFRFRPIAPLLRGLDRIARAILPAKLAGGLNALGGAIFQKPKSAKPSPALDADIQRQIAEFYQRDFELFREVSQKPWAPSLSR